MIVAVDTNCILPGQVGGIENYTLGLIEALRLPELPAKKLVLLTRPENHSLFARFENHRTELVLIERPRGNWAELGEKKLQDFQHRKRDTLLKRRVDVVHFPGNTINPINLELPVVLNLHDLQHRHFPQYFSDEEIALREKWWVSSGRRADALIAGSGFIRDDLCAQIGVHPDKIFVTPDVFEGAFFQRPAATKLAKVRRKFQLPETFFIYPAAGWPHKNHARLIQAFESAAIPQAQLILTGGGHIHPPNIDNVRFLGRVSTENLVAMYCLATALVFPSLYESWSIPIMEAMACGCPVASSNVTSLPEQVADAGILFNPTEISSMAQAMERLAADEPLRKSLAEKGRRRVAQFTSANFVRTMGQAYEYAMNSHRAKKAA